jgi:excisionase family DNA binding protein
VTRGDEISALLTRLAEILSEQQEEVAAQKPERPAPQRVLLTAEEAAEALGVSRTTVFALIKSGDLESVQIGRLRRIPTDCLRSCVERMATKHRDPAA